jgi:hypothetical protein
VKQKYACPSCGKRFAVTSEALVHGAKGACPRCQAELWVVKESNAPAMFATHATPAINGGQKGDIDSRSPASWAKLTICLVLPLAVIACLLVFTVWKVVNIPEQVAQVQGKKEGQKEYPVPDSKPEAEKLPPLPDNSIPSKKVEPKDISDAKAEKKLDPTVDPFAALPKAFTSSLQGEDIAKRLYKSCVWIFGMSKLGLAASGHGTGALIDSKEKIIITNRHVIFDTHVGEAYDKIYVLFPEFNENGQVISQSEHYHNKIVGGRGILAQVVAKSLRQDLALIQLQSIPEGCEALPISAKSVREAQMLHTMGANPEGTDKGQWIYRSGKVGSVYVDDRPSMGKVKAIQSTVQINRGFSGGPVVDDECLLVGVNAYFYDVGSSQTNFHIDISEVDLFLRENYLLLGKPLPEQILPGTASKDAKTTEIIEILINTLGHPEREKREKAIWLLSEYGARARKAVPDLMRLFRKPAEPDKTKSTIKMALNKIGPPLKEFQECLWPPKDGDELDVRLYAVGSLNDLRYSAQRSVPVLLEKFLNDPEIELRDLAAKALGPAGNNDEHRKDVIPRLYELLLNDPSEKVRVSALWSLYQLGAPKLQTSFDLHIRVLQNKQSNQEAKVYAARALLYFGEPAIPALANAIKENESNWLIRQALTSMRVIKAWNPLVRDALADCLDRKDKAVQVAALATLNSFGLTEESWPLYRRTLIHENPQIVREAAGQFYRFNGLINSLNNERLPKLDVERAALEELLLHQVPHARCFAAYYYGSNPKNAPLIEIVNAFEKEREGRVVLSFLWTLQQLELDKLDSDRKVNEGKARKIAWKKMVQVADDLTMNKNVRTYAAITLRKTGANEFRTVYSRLSEALLLDNSFSIGVLDRECFSQSKAMLENGARQFDGGQIAVSQLVRQMTIWLPPQPTDSIDVARGIKVTTYQPVKAENLKAIETGLEILGQSGKNGKTKQVSDLLWRTKYSFHPNDSMRRKADAANASLFPTRPI